jgi:hypothetical protein
MQNLFHQTERPDLFIADMCSDPNLLPNNWMLQTAMKHYEKVRGGKAVLRRVDGWNQLHGHQAGLEYALENGYDVCVSTDDDCTFEEPDWFSRGGKYMREHPDVGVLFGMTFLPHQSIAEQTCPPHLLTHPEYQGTLAVMHYAHCTFLPPWRTPREVEQGFGPFVYRPEDAKKVHGFPIWLSPLGFRGEAITQTAIRFLGKKLIHDPTLTAWHWSVPHGGLRDLPPPGKDEFLKQDKANWERFLARGTASTLKP